MEYVTIIISCLALIVSGITLWLTHLRRGRLKMTHPTVVFFGPDAGDRSISKVFLRTLLYSTGKRGTVLEHLFIRLRRGETQQNFNIWVYGDKELVRGSGLYVGQEGLATNHHFLTPADINGFDFAAGDYELSVYGKVVGNEATLLLYRVHLSLTPEEASKLREAERGIYFDWGQDSGRYQKKIDRQSPKEIDAISLLRLLQGGSLSSSNRRDDQPYLDTTAPADPDRK